MLRKLILCSMACLIMGCGPEASGPQPSPVAQATILHGDANEGLRIATRVGCNGCHGADAGGQVFMEEPGQFRAVAPNLTEHRKLYDDAALERLLRAGKTHDGHRPLGMPVFMFQYLSDREIRDITAWLRSIPAVANPDLPDGWLSDGIKAQLADGTFPIDDDLPDSALISPSEPPTETLALGKHIAMTSCTECHGRDLNGWGPEDDAPSLIVVAKAYSTENFTRLMSSGITAAGTESKTGLMTKVARKRLAVLTPQEVSALKQYLDSR